MFPLFGAIAPPTPPTLHAYRTTSPPTIDGSLNDPVWRDAPGSTAFTQKYPEEGAKPGEPTTVKIAYDDEAIYVAVDCVQQRTPVRAPLTRRDRQVEGDWVSIAIDPRGDAKTAFDFNVSAAGVKVDGIRFNDTDYSTDWDENWEAHTRVGNGGWRVEMRIPLRVLRLPARSRATDTSTGSQGSSRRARSSCARSSWDGSDRGARRPGSSPTAWTRPGRPEPISSGT
jgi:hypothetical protein